MKLNQSGQGMFLPIVIQFGGNPGCNQKVTSNFTYLVLLSLTHQFFSSHSLRGVQLGYWKWQHKGAEMANAFRYIS